MNDFRHVVVLLTWTVIALFVFRYGLREGFTPGLVLFVIGGVIWGVVVMIETTRRPR